MSQHPFRIKNVRRARAQHPSNPSAQPTTPLPALTKPHRSRKIRMRLPRPKSGVVRTRPAAMTVTHARRVRHGKKGFVFQGAGTPSSNHPNLRGNPSRGMA